MKKIFISYKRTNKNQVFQLVKRIENQLGIKCWVDESKKHGKILSIDQTQKSWCIYREFNKQLLTGCNSKVDGLLNLQAIEKIPNWKDKYPAFAWCANHGQGWYLPAIEELETFLSNPVVFNRVNLTLKKLFSPLLKDSGKEYGNGYYWSSTELGNVEAYNLNAERYSGSYNNYRHQSFYVRAICRF